VNVYQQQQQQQSVLVVTPDVNRKELDKLRSDAEQAKRAAEEAKAELEKLRAEAERSKRDSANAQHALEEQLHANTQSLIEQGNRAAQEQHQTQQVQRSQDATLSAIQHQNQASTQRLDRVEGMFGELVLPITERADNWIVRMSAIPVQQNQFCRIIQRFYGDLDQVRTARNDIRQNMLYRDRQEDLSALLQNGGFANWVVRVVEVKQAPDGGAAILLQPPCRAMLGSDACHQNGSPIRGTIQPDTPLYRELAQVSSGDFVVVSGKILYAAAESSNQPLPQYAAYRSGSYCSTSEGTQQEDVFVTQIQYLVKLR